MRRNVTIERVMFELRKENNLAEDVHSSAMDEAFDLSTWILFIEERLKRAKAEIYNLNFREAQRNVKVATSLGMTALRYHEGVEKK